MFLYLKKIINYIKYFFDKIYNKKYNQHETLIRKMFPDPYVEKKNSAIVDAISYWKIDDMVKLLWAYYWEKITDCILTDRYLDIWEYKWILNFLREVEIWKANLARNNR